MKRLESMRKNETGKYLMLTNILPSDWYFISKTNMFKINTIILQIMVRMPKIYSAMS